MSKTPRKRKKNGKRKRRTPYTMGEINKLIDGLIHPLAEKDKGFILIDGLLHALNELNPPQSFTRFVKYNLSEIIKRIEKSSRNPA
jgi:hypothetical protein